MGNKVLFNGLRLDPDDLEDLKQLAEDRALPPRALARSLLVQKLREELDQ